MKNKARAANAEVVGVRRRFVPRLGRGTTIVLAVLTALIVLAAGGMAWATIDYTRDYEGRMLPGTTIAGVRVGGMDPEEAFAAVSDAIRPELDRPITVEWDERSWTVTPRELGARNNAADAVADALAAARASSFLERLKMSVFNTPFRFERDVAIHHSRKGVRGFIRGLAAGIDRDPRDATVDSSSGWVEIVPERIGRTVVDARSRRELLDALIEGRPTADLIVRMVEPSATTKDFDQVLLVRIGENKLYLYQDGEITHSWPVATGQPEYPTPTGLYEIELKRYLPTWVNPAPDTWGKDMPLEIPPGPENPLGLRALNWTAPAIRFHGTSALYSLGYNASHGCVRLSNEDVIVLYDLIEEGTPIVSTVVAPLKPLYVSAPDPTLVPGDEGSDSPSSDPDEDSSKKKRRSG